MFNFSLFQFFWNHWLEITIEGERSDFLLVSIDSFIDWFTYEIVKTTNNIQHVVKKIT